MLRYRIGLGHGTVMVDAYVRYWGMLGDGIGEC